MPRRSPASRLKARLSVRIWVACRYSPCRSEEHTSELQSQSNLVCRLLLEKKNASQPKVSRGKGTEKPQPTSTGASKDHERDNRPRTVAPGPGGATEPSDLVQYPFPLRVGV